MNRKKILYNQGSTYRRDGRIKKKAKKGQYFLDQQSGTLKQAIAKTAQKFYVYDKVAEGPFYVSQIQDTGKATRVIIRNAKTSKIALKVYQQDISEQIVEFLNSNHEKR